MSVLSNKFGRFAKKATAWSLAALTALTCVGTMPLVVSTTAKAASGVLSDNDRGVLYATSRSDFRDETIYFLITTRFYDGDPSNNASTSEDIKAKNLPDDPSWRGDFKGLIDKLDYIKALGFTAIWITPVVQNRSGYDYHGYHAYDFTAVDTRYESNGVTYQDLIDACHAKGMKVIQDVVFNHSCNWGEKNLCPIEIDTWSPGRSAMPMPAGASMDPDKIYHHFGWAGGGDWDNYNVQITTLADDCFDLNTENPKVYNYLIDCYKNFIDMGVDAFRVDTVKHISRLTLNKTFVPALREEYKKVHTGSGYDDFYMFGEVCTKGESVWYRDQPPISTCFYTWKDDDTWLSKWSDDPDANLALTEEHYNAHNNTGDQPTTDNALLRGNEYHAPDNSIRSGLDSIDFQMHWQFDSAGAAFGMAQAEDPYFSDATWNVTYVNSHDYSPNNRQTIVPDFDEKTWAEDLSLIFSFRGIPCIYYGTEIRFQAGKLIDKGPELPLSETGRAYFGDNIEGEILTGDPTVFYADGAAKETLSSPLSQHLIRLNRIRQAVPALRKGQYSTEGCNGGLAFKRRYTDSSTDSFCCVTISGDATFTGIPDGTYVDAVTGDTKTVSGGTLSVSCSGQGNMRVYVLNTAKTPAPGRVIPNGSFLTDGGAAEIIMYSKGDIHVGDVVDETSVSVTPSKLTIKQHETASVTATVEPSNATYRTVTWSSSDESVATVSGGTIKGVSVGTAKITAKTKNGKTATVNVTVVKNDSIVEPTGVSVSPSSLKLSTGETGKLTATVTPSNATDKSVTWSTSNDKVAAVSEGTVTAVGSGTATITAKTSNGKTATATITVEGPSLHYVDHGIYFEKPSGWGTSVKAYIYDSVTNSPDGVGPAWPGQAMKGNADGTYYLEFSSTNSNLKVIFNDGLNQAPQSQAPGFDYKDCGYYTEKGWQKKLEKPSAEEVTSVSVNPASATVNVGSTTTLTASVSPSTATDKTITWSSNNTSVATVSNGVVKGIAEGTATITAKSSNGKTATASIKVEKVIVPVYDLKNTSKLSAASISLKSSVKVSCSSTGGSGTVKYAVWYKQSTSDSWTKAQDYSTNKTVTVTPKHTGTYTVRVKAKDGSGTVKSKDLTLKVTAALANTSKLSATSVSVGSAVTVTCSSTGGTGTKKYRVAYKRSGSDTWTTAQDYSTTTSVKITPKYADTYTIAVKVKDCSGTVKRKDLTVKAVKNLTNTSKLSAASISLKSSVKVSCSSTGGSGTVKYAVWYKQSTSDSWTKAQDYSTNKTVTVTPKHTGTYTVRVKAKDGSGTVKSKDLTLKVTAALTNTSKVSASSVSVGGTVTVTCASTGGTGTKKYRVAYKRAGSDTWTTAQDYSTTTSVKITPKHSDTYTIRVKVKDGSGKIVSKDLTVKVVLALTNTSKLSASTSSVNTAVTVTCASTGGTGTKKYRVAYKRAGSDTWTTAQDYSTTTSVKVTPKHVDTYTIRVKVKDGSGTIKSKDLTLKVTDPSALTNKSTISATSVTAGNYLKVTCAASNGTKPYYYKVEKMKSGDSDWTLVKDFASVSTVSVKFPSKGTYQVKVTVSDMAGKTATKYFTVTSK